MISYNSVYCSTTSTHHFHLYVIYISILWYPWYPSLELLHTGGISVLPCPTLLTTLYTSLLAIAYRWALTSYNWSFNPYKQPYKWVFLRLLTLLKRSCFTPLITCRLGPPCNTLDTSSYPPEQLRNASQITDVFLSPLVVFVNPKKNDSTKLT